MSDEECNGIKNNGEPCTYPAKYPDGKCGHHTDTDGVNEKKSMLEENPGIAELIQGEIQNGATVSEACSEANVAQSTHGNWMQKGKDENAKDIYKEYRNGVMRARRTAAKNERRQLKVMCAEQGDTRTYWKIHQEQYGDLYAGDSEESEETQPIFAMPEAIAKEWQQPKQ